MPSAVQDQDQDQSMMDATPQDQEQQFQTEDDDLLEMEEKRIVLVRQRTFKHTTYNIQSTNANVFSSPVLPKPLRRSSSRGRVIRWGMRCGSRS